MRMTDIAKYVLIRLPSKKKKKTEGSQTKSSFCNKGKAEEYDKFQG